MRWSDLATEFDRWQDAGDVATLWWRDDDAALPTEPLRRLLSKASGVPVSLAVIPAVAEHGLAAWLTEFHSAQSSDIAVLQHGWRHLNHSGAGKKSEFPAARPRADVASDLSAGRIRLGELFGARALPVLVPPWNRFDEGFLGLLRTSGLTGISRSLPRRSPRPAPGLIEVNVHVDLVAWTAGRRFIGEQAALCGLVNHLRARRLGIANAEEPTGVLTHHLLLDEETDSFLGQLIAISTTHPAARWLGAAEIFAPAPPVRP